MTDPTDPATRVVLLVEGESDRVALTTVARRRDRDLAAEGVRIVVMGGATNVNRHISELAPTGVRLGGLYDAAEQHFCRRALERHGLRAEGSAEPLEAQGFFVCVPDLEGELVTALGVDGVRAVVAAEEGPGAFPLLQQQPAQRGRPVEEQLRRFLAIKSGRKARYAALLTEAVPLDRVPQPLDGVLAWAADRRPRPPVH